MWRRIPTKRLTDASLPSSSGNCRFPMHFDWRGIPLAVGLFSLDFANRDRAFKEAIRSSFSSGVKSVWKPYHRSWTTSSKEAAKPL
jgi:hypothetical protein